VSRIVFATIGSLGDLHPKISLALELRARGHEVAIATHREYRQRIEAIGLPFSRLRPDNTAMDDPQEMARMMDLRTGTEYVIRNWLVANLRESYRDLLEIASDADLIVAGEGAIAARLVAEKLQIPWVLAVLQPTSFLSVDDPPILPIFPFLSRFRPLGAIAGLGMRQLAKILSRAWAEPIHEFRRELELPPLVGNPFIEDKYSPNLVLAMFSAVFAPPQPDWPKNTVTTGFAFFDGGGELSPELAQFFDSGEPPIVFTLGSAAVMTPGNFYQESIQAARLVNRRAVLLVGKNEIPTDLPRSIIALAYAPYSLVFSRSSAIVHQGGIGTTAQALRAGRPTLIMPYSHDQPDNAARVQRLGTSRTIPRSRYSAVEVARNLREILGNPDYGAKAQEIGQAIDQENGVTVACEAIDRQLR
jgi:rhamnosyltransferase subunit B